MSHEDNTFPLSYRDRNWTLERYAWNEETGVAEFAYQHKYVADAKVEELRPQPKYVMAPESTSVAAGANSKRIARGGGR